MTKQEQYQKIIAEYKKAQKSPYMDVKRAFERILAELSGKVNGK